MDNPLPPENTEFALRRSVALLKQDPKAAKEAFRAVAKGFCPHCGKNHRVLTPDQCADRRMSEKTLQSRVVARAKRLGWDVKHVGKGMTGVNGVWVSTAKGFPDLFMLHEREKRALAVELKREQGEFEPGQVEYLQLLNICGIPAVVFRPHHLRDGTMKGILGPQ